MRQLNLVEATRRAVVWGPAPRPFFPLWAAGCRLQGRPQHAQAACLRLRRRVCVCVCVCVCLVSGHCVRGCLFVTLQTELGGRAPLCFTAWQASMPAQSLLPLVSLAQVYSYFTIGTCLCFTRIRVLADRGGHFPPDRLLARYQSHGWEEQQFIKAVPVDATMPSLVGKSSPP